MIHLNKDRICAFCFVWLTYLCIFIWISLILFTVVQFFMWVQNFRIIGKAYGMLQSTYFASQLDGVVLLRDRIRPLLDRRFK